jgi:hypothetical protein
MSEAALRASVPPHVSKDSPAYGIYCELCSIHHALKSIEEQSKHEKTFHTVEDLDYYRQEVRSLWHCVFPSIRQFLAPSLTHARTLVARTAVQLNAVDSARGAGGIFAGSLNHDDKAIIPGTSVQ